MKRAIPVTTLFLDIGGILLTIGWDHHARKGSDLMLRQIGEGLSGLDYNTVDKAMQRFAATLSDGRQKRRVARSSLRKLSHVEGLLPKPIPGYFPTICKILQVEFVENYSSAFKRIFIKAIWATARRDMTPTPCCVRHGGPP